MLEGQQKPIKTSKNTNGTTYNTKNNQKNDFLNYDKWDKIQEPKEEHEIVRVHKNDTAIDNYNKAMHLKNEGNYFFKQNLYSKAIQVWQQAEAAIDTEVLKELPNEVELRTNTTDLQLKIVFNQSTAYLEQKNWDAALKYSEQILKIKKKDPRAYLTAGKCQWEKGLVTNSWRTLKEGLPFVQECGDSVYKEKYIKFYNEVASSYNEYIEKNKATWQNTYENEQYEKGGLLEGWANGRKFLLFVGVPLIQSLTFWYKNYA